MNLLHHLVVAQILHEKLGWPQRLRGAMLLGAIAPDAHTEMEGLDRSIFHPAEGSDAVDFTLNRIDPPSAVSDAQGKAFAVSCIGHLVSDQMTRSNKYHLPPHAPTGFQPVNGPAGADGEALILDAGAVVRDLMRAEAPCLPSPLTLDALDAKRWEVLARYPLVEGEGLFLIVEPLASVARECAAATLTAIIASDLGANLLAGRPLR